MNFMNPTDVSKIRNELEKGFEDSLLDTMIFVHEECRKVGNKPSEPTFIAGLTLRFIKDIYSTLSANFSKNYFRVTGVYCHQKPLADFGSKPRPEIGDILFVYSYTDKTGGKRYNSLLLQAKIIGASIAPFLMPIPSTEIHQLTLYTKWPLFKYAKAGSLLNGTSRNILPKKAHDGAQYLLIDSDARCHKFYLMETSEPDTSLAPKNTLVSDLIDFISFKSGRPFDEDPFTSPDEWTKMIWDLLKISEKVTAPVTRMGVRKMDRQVYYEWSGVHASFTVVTSVSSNPFTTVPPILNSNNDDTNSDEQSGISIILIESSEQEGLIREG